MLLNFGGSLSPRFLAAMSSSRSDVVTQFVFACVRVFVPFFFFWFLLDLKSFNGVSRLFKGCLKLRGSFKGVSRKS